MSCKAARSGRLRFGSQGGRRAPRSPSSSPIRGCASAPCLLVAACTHLPARRGMHTRVRTHAPYQSRLCNIRSIPLCHPQVSVTSLVARVLTAATWTGTTSSSTFGVPSVLSARLLHALTAEGATGSLFYTLTFSDGASFAAAGTQAEGVEVRHVISRLFASRYVTSRRTSTRTSRCITHHIMSRTHITRHATLRWAEGCVYAPCVPMPPYSFAVNLAPSHPGSPLESFKQCVLTSGHVHLRRHLGCRAPTHPSRSPRLRVVAAATGRSASR